LRRRMLSCRRLRATALFGDLSLLDRDPDKAYAWLAP
jgi:hypothetical protein